MQKSILIFFIILAFINANGQLRPIPTPLSPPTQEQEDSDQLNHQCKYLNKYSVEQRNSFYPFNVAKNIKLVSFGIKPVKNGFTSPDGQLPMKNKKIVYSDLMEVKTLSKSQIDSLTDLLYNNIYTGYFSTITEAQCYNPRNAILFLDDNGALIVFIEICFECQRYRTNSQKVVLGDFCSQKYDLLKEFFQQAGIEFGITRFDE